MNIIRETLTPEFTKQISTEVATGEKEGYGFTPDEKELINDAYKILTKLSILGIEMHNEKLVVACDNLQNIIDEL